jgi:hypothetical protein
LYRKYKCGAHFSRNSALIIEEIYWHRLWAVVINAEGYFDKISVRYAFANLMITVELIKHIILVKLSKVWVKKPKNSEKKIPKTFSTN